MSQIESIKEAWDSGKSISGIAEALGIDRKTVRKYLAKEDFNIGIPAEEKHASKLDPYKDEIRAMAGTGSSAIQQRGYTKYSRRNMKMPGFRIRWCSAS